MNQSALRNLMSTMLRLYLQGLKLVFIAYIAGGVLLYVFQSSLIYYPDRTDWRACEPFVHAEQIVHGSSHGYLTRRSSDKLLVYYHGNAGRACDRSFFDSFFAERGYSTYFVEYTGYADNETASMEQILANVRDTVDFIRTQDFTSVTVMGESIGVGPAAYHAHTTHVDDLILVTAYDSIASVAFNKLPVYPVRYMLDQNFTPDQWLTDYRGPVSVILAEQDEVIPRAHGTQLFSVIPSGVKKLYVITGAGHNSIYGSDEYYAALGNALQG